MPTVEVPYGDGTIAVDVDAECEVVLPAEDRPDGVDFSPAPSGGDLITRALEAPVGGPPLEEFLDGVRVLTVIVNDATRSTPTARVLDALLPHLTGVPEVRFVVATGTHRPPTDAELRVIFGRHLEDLRGRLHVHDARDRAAHVRVGTTSRGTKVLLDRRVVDADAVLTVGSVEPHYFAGFSGGRKSILPGVAAYRTVEMNHAHAVDPRAAPAVLDGNPVHEDMVEAVDLLGRSRIFTVQMLLGRDGRALAVASGDLDAAFGAMAARAVEVQCVPCRTADIVLTCVPPPKDIEMYQSQHALEHGALAVRDGGIVIWVSACRKGVGNDRFLHILREEVGPDGDPERDRTYRLGDHKALRIRRLLERVGIWPVMGIDDGLLRGTGMLPYHDIQTAVDDAIACMRGRGMEPRVLVMPNGTRTVPQIVG